MALTGNFAVKEALKVGKLNNPKTRVFGGGTQFVAVPGVVVNIGGIGCLATSETTCLTITVAAGAIDNDSDGLEVDGVVFFANNGNTKRWRLYLSGVAVIDTNNQTWANYHLAFRFRIIRTNSTSGIVIGDYTVYNRSTGALVAQVSAIAAASVTWGSSWVFKTTTQGGATDDVIEYASALKYMPKGN